MRNYTALCSLACALSMTGCMTGVDDLGSVSDDLSLVECDRDDACERGEVCLTTEDRGRTVGYCSTGDRCTSSRVCPSGSVCRGGDDVHCMVVQRDEPAACPRGSIEGYVLCAPGFENVCRLPHFSTGVLPPRFVTGPPGSLGLLPRLDRGERGDGKREAGTIV